MQQPILRWVCGYCGVAFKEKRGAIDCHDAGDGIEKWYWCRNKAAYYLKPCECCTE